MKAKKAVLAHFGCDVEAYMHSAYFLPNSLKDPECDIKETFVLETTG
jgi:hypothetical protein